MFENVKRAHILGIGGIGASALALWLHQNGKKVEGCDQEDSPWIDTLRKKGLRIAIGHDASHISQKTDLVIYSLAFFSSHPEILEAKKRKIPMMSYPEALGIMTKYFRTIAVCGTHGKTTTTAMLSKILIENNFDPTVIVGTQSPDLSNQNFRCGKNKLFVVEACEYRRAFLHCRPKAIVLTNMEHDHFDAFPTWKSYQKVFQDFLGKLPKDGYLFANADDPAVSRLIQRLLKQQFPPYNIFTFGTKKKNVRFQLQGKKVIFDGKHEGKFSLRVPGQHNLMNALAAYAVARIFNMAPKDIFYSLNQYEGSARRLELKGVHHGVRIYDDYAHHPTEIEATLEALREINPKEKICVAYQPHQFNRTKHLLKEFGKAFRKADFVIVPDIYKARDSRKSQKSVGVKQFVEVLKKNGTSAIDGEGIPATAQWLKKHLKDFQVVVLMGAGDVWKIYGVIASEAKQSLLLKS